MTDTRPCTCAPDERPYPCQHQYALGLCRKAEIRSLRTALDRLIAQIADMQKLRLEDELIHGNVMGRIAIALFGDQNNRTDEECVARSAEIGYELSGAKLRAERAEAELAAARTRPDSEAADAIKVVREFLRRVTHWQEGKPDCHDAMEALDKADDDIDWIEHGIIEWRDVALKAQSDLAAALENVKDYKENSALFLRQRDEARTELAAARALLSLARLALIYHQQQTRPIHDTVDMISAIDAALAAPGEAK